MTQNYIKTRVRLPNNNESNLFTYVPFADRTNPGIAAFDENQFSINNDTHIVTLNINFTGQYYTKPEVDTLLSEKVSKVTESRRIYATDANGVTTTYPWSVSRTAYNTNIEKNSFVRRSEGRIPGIANPSDSHDAANKDYVDTEVSTKVDKVTSATGILRVYGIGVDGQQMVFDVSEANVCGTIVKRNDAGQVAVGQPTLNDHATNKDYVDTGLSTKVDKLLEIETFAVYVGNPDGTQTYKYLDNLALGDSIPLRDSNGNIHVGDAREVGHATNKGYVDTAIAARIGRVYKPAGSMSFAELINTVIPGDNTLGNVYNISNSFVTTVAFIEGAGKSYGPGENVAIIQSGSNYYYDVLSSAVDLSNYYTKTATDSLLLGYVKKDAESNILLGNLEVNGYLQVSGSLVNGDGYSYLNETESATIAEMEEIFEVLS